MLVGGDIVCLDVFGNVEVGVGCSLVFVGV